ncbi:MAG: hypothetical protein IPL79_04100 [Myxococcales bacterium]|nr:hypothetical protein [Myxococcales bacterium]
MRADRWLAHGVALWTGAALVASCAHRGPRPPPAQAPIHVLQDASPDEVFAAIASTTRAALPSGPAGLDLAILPLSPRPVTVWFSEPAARVEVVAAIDAAQPHLVGPVPLVNLTTQSAQVAARVLGKVPAAISASAGAVDDAVVLVDLARLADANSAAETLGIVASLLGHSTDPAKMVVATLHRDGMLAAVAGVLDVSKLPAAITAIAVAPGTRWQVTGRHVAVVEASDIYDVYEFITGKQLPRASWSSEATTESDRRAERLARLAPLWPRVLTIAHDYPSPVVRDIAARSQAAARSSEVANQVGALDLASIWAGEALTLARAAGALAERAGSPQAAAPRDVIDEYRLTTAMEDVPPAERAEDASLAENIARLRWAAAPAGYPLIDGSAPHRGLAAQLARLHHLGQPASPAMIRWHQLAMRYLSVEATGDGLAGVNADELHRVAALRLFSLTMLLDELVEQRLRELMSASPALGLQ